MVSARIVDQVKKLTEVSKYDVLKISTKVEAITNRIKISMNVIKSIIKDSERISATDEENFRGFEEINAFFEQ